MKKGLLFAVIGIVWASMVQAQIVQLVTVSPLPALDCSTTVVTVEGQLNCINAIINGGSSSIVGNTIFVDIDMTQPPICLPALGIFSEPVIVGNIPPGNYTLTARTIVNGSLFNSLSQPLTVGSCCPTNGDFTVSDDKFCPGEIGVFAAIDPNLPSYTWYVDGVAVGGNMNQLMYAFPGMGVYSISLKADDGICFDSTFQTVVVDSPQIQFTTVMDESCEGSQDGAITASVSGGFLPLNYSWSNGSNMLNQSNLTAGTYTLTVSDGQGCVGVDSVVVELDTAVMVEITSPQALNYCAGDTLQFSSMQSGATSIQWLIDGQNYASTDTSWVPTAGSVYVIRVVATDGVCSDSMDADAIVADSLKLSSIVTDESCAGDMDGSIDISTSGGQAPFQYVWSHGPTSEDVSGLDTGSYVVDIMDEAGCMATDTFAITTLGGITASFTYTTSDTLVAFSGTSTPGAVSWAWDFGDNSAGSSVQSPTHTYADSGFYGVCVGVTDEFGCTDTFCENIEITITVGLSERVVESLALVPNPASTFISLDNLPVTLVEGEIVLRDALGRMVMRQADVKAKRLSIQGLANGLYTVEVRADSKIWRGKFLKQ